MESKVKLADNTYPFFFEVVGNKITYDSLTNDLKGCIRYICASLFLKSKRKHLSN